MAEIPEHLGDQHQVQAFHVAAQLGSVRGLAHQVKLVVQVGVELGHHLARLEALAVGRELLDQLGHRAHQRQVAVDHRQHARAQHLDGNIAQLARTGADGGKVHLGNRGAGNGLFVKADKDLGQRLAEGPLDGLHRNARVERGHAVLQQGQLFGDIGGQQIAPGRQHLAELDKDRAKLLQRLAQALTARLGPFAAYAQYAGDALEPGVVEARQHHVMQAIAPDHPQNGEAAKKALHVALRSLAGSLSAA